MRNVVCVSGGFDVCHPGHTALFEAASKYGPLTVILNSDTWLIRKKGYRVMNWQDRAAIIAGFRWVTAVEPVDDRDGTVCEALQRIRPQYFAKSGDRNPTAMPQPELETCRELGIEVLYNVCPHLPYSSSRIIAHRRPDEESVHRPWGSYHVFDQQTYPQPPHWKLKRLDLAPGQRTSLQRHQNREEHWVIVRGQAEIRTGNRTKPHLVGSYIHIRQGSWHQIINASTTVPLTLIEVQMGRACEETDIERRENNGL